MILVIDDMDGDDRGGGGGGGGDWGENGGNPRLKGPKVHGCGERSTAEIKRE